jgi:hypothetical protein
MIHQVLAAGVHGIQLCHARSPKAVKLLVAACRYPMERANIQKNDLEEGWRGEGSEAFAAKTGACRAHGGGAGPRDGGA